ncbi:hypothetical protein [Hoeflea ulvae]|uniref:Uncharacterized protein n=1 Tax=Hoeflea ulvae TaxID=2983764 RepID=A0ABT3YDE6_9HYPH|nr:hypothetical protein [Hoeflea ulvae]MCY0093908.1 hypothetical protein [Hoeflea ulvae]
MFKIAKADSIAGFGTQPQGFVAPDQDILSQYCQIESWTADLSTGVFHLGPAARLHHGLSGDGDFGLFNLMQCYDSQYRQHVLELYEVAAMSPSSFCFSTTIVHEDGSQVPVMCIGESSNFSEDGGGAINGVFVFPTFKLNKAQPYTQ